MCVMCSKEIDVEWNRNYVLLNSDGDFACSRKCADAYHRKLRFIGGVVCQSEANCLSYLKGTMEEPNFYDP